MNDFLKLKNRDLFYLILVFPFVLGVILLLITKIFNDQLVEYRLLVLIPLITVTGFLGWIRAVGVGLQKKLPNELKLNPRVFKIILWVSFLVFIFNVVLLFIDNPIKMDVTFDRQLTVSEMIIQTIYSIVSTLFGISIITILYCFYFAAKTIRTAELKRKVTISDLAGYFLMICLFPIGIWILQPKINKMIDQ